MSDYKVLPEDVAEITEKLDSAATHFMSIWTESNKTKIKTFLLSIENDQSVASIVRDSANDLKKGIFDTPSEFVNLTKGFETIIGKVKDSYLASNISLKVIDAAIFELETKEKLFPNVSTLSERKLINSFLKENIKVRSEITQQLHLLADTAVQIINARILFLESAYKIGDLATFNGRLEAMKKATEELIKRTEGWEVLNQILEECLSIYRAVRKISRALSLELATTSGAANKVLIDHAEFFKQKSLILKFHDYIGDTNGKAFEWISTLASSLEESYHKMFEENSLSELFENQDLDKI